MECDARGTFTTVYLPIKKKKETQGCTVCVRNSEKCRKVDDRFESSEFSWLIVVWTDLQIEFEGFAMPLDRRPPTTTVGKVCVRACCEHNSNFI